MEKGGLRQKWRRCRGHIIHRRDALSSYFNSFNVQHSQWLGVKELLHRVEGSCGKVGDSVEGTSFTIGRR